MPLDSGYDFAVSNISTGYLVALLRSSVLVQGILWPSCAVAVINIGTGDLNRPNWLLAGYSVYHRVASQGFPTHNVYDRPAIWAPATVQYCDRVCIMKFFSKVYCDRVYFLCTERIATESGFRPPAAPPPPVHMKVECPPPPGAQCS